MQELVEVTKTNIDDYLENYNVIICKIRNSRLKAKELAALEIYFAQKENEILIIKNTPLGDIKGIFALLCPKKNIDNFKDKLYGIGYCNQFFILDFENETCENKTILKTINPLTWKNKKFSIYNFYRQDEKIYEEHSPHNREFKIVDSEGDVKTVFGYRGDGSELGRRSLPVEDARCMVNLSIPSKNKKALDPFAGAGGIVFEHRYIQPDGKMTSMDIDPVLKPGLEFYGSTHHVMNAVDAYFPQDSFNAVVTEVPFSASANDDIVAALKKINACVAANGMFVIMCAKEQFGVIGDAMAACGCSLVGSHEVDRKGTEVVVGVWGRGLNCK